MYFNNIKYILNYMKLFKIDLLFNKTLKYIITCVGSILTIYLYFPFIPKIEIYDSGTQ